MRSSRQKLGEHYQKCWLLLSAVSLRHIPELGFPQSDIFVGNLAKASDLIIGRSAS